MMMMMISMMRRRRKKKGRGCNRFEYTSHGRRHFMGMAFLRNVRRRTRFELYDFFHCLFDTTYLISYRNEASSRGKKKKKALLTSRRARSGEGARRFGSVRSRRSREG